MKKLIGSVKTKTAIFISGTGTNFKKLYRFSLSKRSPIIIKFVVSNNKFANGLIFANKNNIKNKTYNFKKKQNAEKKILNDLKKKKIDLICLAGFMKILSKSFIKRFGGKILNIHPSLLPKYKGLNTHERVIRNKEKYSGCTIHFVSSKLDSGKIIMQKKVKINKNETIKSLKDKVLKQEHILYPRAIKKLFSNL